MEMLSKLGENQNKDRAKDGVDRANKAKDGVDRVSKLKDGDNKDGAKNPNKLMDMDITDITDITDMDIMDIVMNMAGRDGVKVVKKGSLETKNKVILLQMLITLS